MALGDLPDALTTAAVVTDGCLVQLQRPAADALSFEPGAPPGRAPTPADQVAWEFCDRADDAVSSAHATILTHNTFEYLAREPL
jgi:hypothetical protein